MKNITMLIQRILGVIMIGLGLWLPSTMDGDITASLVVVAIGSIALFSKTNVLYDKFFIVKDEEEEES